MSATLVENTVTPVTDDATDETFSDEQLREMAEMLVLSERKDRALEPDREVVQSIFANRTSLYTKYRVTATFNDQILGGTPSNPDILETHLRISVGLTDQAEETRIIMRQVMQERYGLEGISDTELDKFIAATKEVAKTKSTNGFRRDKQGLFVPSRYVKAMLREATNILYAGERWGATKKGPRNFLAERVFVDTASDRIYLGRQEADDVVLIIGHVDGPQGKKSTLAHHESCIQPSIEFVFGSLLDSISEDKFMEILELSQDLGLGSCRSQGYGRFSVTGFEKVSQGKVRSRKGSDEE